jgi:hypothetical protein
MDGSINHSPERTPGGYLLFEIVLALMVASAVLAGVFAIANGSLSLANSMSEEGADVITHEAFLTFMGRNFESLPGNAVLDLTLEEGASHYLSDLTFQNVPTAFSWAGQTLSAEAVQLSTVPRRGGNLDIVLRYYEEPILDDNDSTASVNAEPIAELVLLRDVYRFEWYAIDGRTMEPSDTWDVRGRLPLQMKLDVIFDANSERVIHHFWIPPKVNPETVIRSQRMQGRTPGGGANPGSDENPQEGPGPRGGNPEINPRGGQPRQ